MPKGVQQLAHIRNGRHATNNGAHLTLVLLARVVQIAVVPIEIRIGDRA